MDDKNFNPHKPNEPLQENYRNSSVISKLKAKKKILIITSILCVITITILTFFYRNKSNQQSPELYQSAELIETEQPISIKSTILTEFAEYKPYTVDIIPNADSYNLPVNWNKIKNRQKFNLSNKVKQKLIKQGFVAIPTKYDEIYSIYKDNTENGRPNFVTIDSVLHAFHILYDYTLRNIELNKFIPDLKNLNKVLLQTAINQYNSITDPKLKSAARKNVAYFAVASKLLEPETSVPADVKNIVEKELSLIDKHEGFQYSPIFGYIEDYSQYIPRGHYTRNEDFKKYFKTMMWYGRMRFRITSQEETRQALLISLMLKQAKVNQEDALKVWDRIYQVTSFFVGKTDDFNVYDYFNVMKKVFGENISVNSLADDRKIDQVIAELKKLLGPKIFSSFVLKTEDPTEATKGFRFMGQRFVPDSYIFHQLVFPNVKDYIGTEPQPFTAETIGLQTVRAFPRGLDVAAVLGSKRAKEILDREGDSAFYGYNEQFQKLRQEFSSLPQNKWVENLYWNWLYSLLPTLTVKGKGYPIFMRQAAWLDKDLNSFLGSWTELRHDTILYAKQSYTMIITAPILPIQLQLKPKVKDRGYVEPNPEVYARLASLAKFMREGLESRNLLSSEYKYKLTKMEEILLTLKTISEKELTNKDLEKDDYEFIKNIGHILENLVSFSIKEMKEIASETDTKMEIIADVHTDSNTFQVLEEAIGKPLNLLVVVKDGGELYLTSGPIFSYYEFKHPMRDRLTDEKWQKIKKPPLPNFTQSFVVK